MQNIVLATASLNQTALDFEGNVERISAAIKMAVENEAHILTLPELAVCGYGCEDEFFSIDICKRSEAAVKKMLPLTKGILTVFGVPIYFEGGLYNCAVVAKDEKIIGITAKKFLAREGIHYEPRWFTPWNKGRHTTIDYAGYQDTYFGDLFFKVGEIGIGVEICEEAWGAESPIDEIAGACEVILNMSASHFSLGKNQIRRQLVADASRSLCVFYAYSNLVGLDAGKVIYDGATFIAFNGKLLRQGKRFSFEDVNVDLCPADLNLVRVNKIRQSSSFNRAEQDGLEKKPFMVKVEPFSSADAALKVFQVDENETMSVESEFHDAVTLGLFDYMRKTFSEGYVISLSGGCDSSSCAYLVASMIHKAVEELGLELACETFRLSSHEFEKSNKNQVLEFLVSKLLVCIYQASANSGAVTKEAAKRLAAGLGARFVETQIQDVVDIYVKQAESHLKRSMDWTVDDIALQNIQARARAPFPWMVANIENKILITTSNRSEASVGYTTMDGDSAGGLAPLAGIDKEFLRKWLRWAEKEDNSGIGAISSLSCVNEQQPTAELRPNNMKQTDEDDLMSYKLLDSIERYMVRDKMSKAEVLAFISRDYGDLPLGDLSAAVDKFRTLWRTNQWKRERLAPSFHLDDYSVDSNSWCRFPIISGS